MNEEQKKAKKLVIGLFLFCICIALVCFGFFAYTLYLSRTGGVVSDRMVSVSKAVVMAGIFFLVLAFGYLLPVLFSRKNKSQDRGGSVSSSGVFDEANMRRALEGYIPDGETLLAGIHAVSKETNITCVFGKCICTESRLIPDENGKTVTLNKKKYSTYDVYLGITQHSLVITECGENQYLYQLDDKTDAAGADIQEVTSDILLTDIGTRFSLSDIQSCKIEKGWMGSVNCYIHIKGGSYFKLMLPKLGGLGDGMPHHAEYREAIIARLGESAPGGINA